jgi:hypothetical protein
MTRQRASVAALAVIAAIVVALAITRGGPAATTPVATPRAAPGFAFTGPPPIDPAPWRNVRWNAVASSLDLPPGMQVAGMTALPGALFAFGQGPLRGGMPPPANGLISTGTIWLSLDALSWQAHPILEGVPNGNVSEVRTVAAGPKGIVALGTVCCGGNESLAAWWSADGQTWQRAGFPGAREAGPMAAAAGPAGFAAVGVADGNGAIWTSADGLGWQRVRDGAAELGVGRLDDVVATPEGFIAAGYIEAAPQDSDGAIWVSQGLDAWHRVAAVDPALVGKDETSLGKVVPFAGGVFAAGGVGNRNDRVQCEGLLNGQPAAGAADTALSCGWLREMNWRSQDGGAWQRVDPWGRDATYPPDFVGPPPRRAPADWARIVAGGPGLVALPYELVEGKLDSSGTELGVWTSADGRTWERVAAGPDLKGELAIGWGVVGRQIVVISEKGAVFVGTALP